MTVIPSKKCPRNGRVVVQRDYLVLRFFFPFSKLTVFDPERTGKLKLVAFVTIQRHVLWQVPRMPLSNWFNAL